MNRIEQQIRATLHLFALIPQTEVLTLEEDGLFYLKCLGENARKPHYFTEEAIF